MNFCYISVDIEGSHGKGERPPVLNVLSIGACVIGDPRTNFYVELKPVTEHWDPEAEKIHKLSRTYLREHGLDARLAMLAFSGWTERVAGDAIAVFCATPLSYDFVMLDIYFSNFGIPNPYLQQLDGRALYRRLKRIPTGADVPRENIWRDYPTTHEHTHNALDDALEQEEVFRQMLREAGLL